MNYLGSPRVSLTTRKIAADAALALADAQIHCEVMRNGTASQKLDAEMHVEGCELRLGSACLEAAIEYHATA